jgi:hypothetical protein
MVGTSIDTVGARTARWVVANPIIERLLIDSVAEPSLHGRRVLRNSSATADRLAVHSTAHTRLAFPAKSGLVPGGQLRDSIRIGDLVHLTGTSDTPDLPASEFWALSISLVVLK